MNKDVGMELRFDWHECARKHGSILSFGHVIKHMQDMKLCFASCLADVL